MEDRTLNWCTVSGRDVCLCGNVAATPCRSVSQPIIRSHFHCLHPLLGCLSVCASLLLPPHQNTSWLLRADCSKNCFSVGAERAINHLHSWGSWQCRRWLLSLAIGCQFAQARRDSPLCLLCAFHVESRGFGAANDVIGLLTERCLCLFIIPLIYNVSAWTHFGGNIGRVEQSLQPRAGNGGWAHPGCDVA